MHLPIGLLARLGQSLEEILPVHIVQIKVLAPVPAAQSPVQALVGQNAHGSDRFQHRELAGLDDRDYLLPFDRGKALEKVFNGFTSKS